MANIIKFGGGAGGIDPSSATATVDKVLAGYTFYAGNENLKTGTALSTSSTADATSILSGKTAYNNLGELMTGTLVPSHLVKGTLSGGATIDFGFNINFVALYSTSMLSKGVHYLYVSGSVIYESQNGKNTKVSGSTLTNGIGSSFLYVVGSF